VWFGQHFRIQPNRFGLQRIQHDTAPIFAKLFNYPSIGQLFSEKEIGKLEEFFARLTVTDENLERVIRYGNQSEAEKATRASQAVKITLEFLRNLKEMQTANKK
jgi:hypothetical protein